MSLMPQAWYSIKMSGLHSSSLCMEHDEAAAMYANITFAVFIVFFFSCCDKHTLAGWGPIEVVQPVRVSLFKNHVLKNAANAGKPVRRPGDTRRGPRTRNALSIVWQMARRSLVLFRASYVSLWLGFLNATIQEINAEMGHEHFFERMVVLYLSMFW